MDSLENMAIDEEHYKAAQEMSATEYLVRLYEWKVPCISLGMSQQQQNILYSELLDGVDVVQRITGGLSVYHYREITYSIAAARDSLYFGGSLYESYEKIAQLLVCFLKALGLNGVQYDKKKQASRFNRTAVCFLYSGYGEIHLEGKKLIGSAQKRGKKGFLQHGSIPVYRTPKVLEDYLKTEHKPLQRTPYLYLGELVAEGTTMVTMKSLLKREIVSYIAEVDAKK